MSATNGFTVSADQIEAMTLRDAQRYIGQQAKAFQSSIERADNATDRAVNATQVARKHGLLGVRGAEYTLESWIVYMSGGRLTSKGQASGWVTLAIACFERGISMDSDLWMRLRNSNAYQKGDVTKVIKTDGATPEDVEKAIEPFATPDGKAITRGGGTRKSSTADEKAKGVTLAQRVPKDPKVLASGVNDVTKVLKRHLAAMDDVAYAKWEKSFSTWLVAHHKTRAERVAQAEATA